MKNGKRSIFTIFLKSKRNFQQKINLFIRGLKMKCFIVNSEDLLDPKKNPGLKLSVKSILKNKKIKKIANNGKV